MLSLLSSTEAPPGCLKVEGCESPTGDLASSDRFRTEAGGGPRSLEGAPLVLELTSRGRTERLTRQGTPQALEYSEELSRDGLKVRTNARGGLRRVAKHAAKELNKGI